MTSYLNISYGSSDSMPSYVADQAVSLYVGGELITDLVIPEGVTAIPSCAFIRVSNITRVTIPEGVTSIGSYAFQYCSSLESVIFEGESLLTSIGYCTFSDCSSLTSITIPDRVTSIGRSAFEDCSSLTSIKIPESVTSIGYSAFRNCSSLTSIIIPSTVTSIGSYAFRDCDNLTIYCEASSEPSGWEANWNYARPFYWAGEWKMVDGVPVPIESGVESLGLSEIGEDFGIGFDGLGFRGEIYFNDKRERKVV